MKGARRLFGSLTEAAPAPAEAAVRGLAEQLHASARARLGRALALLHVDTGSCGGCEIQIRAARGAVHDLARFGLGFVASPRHADVLLVTGVLTHAMHAPLRAAWEAMADPKWVVALGDCALDGGLFRGSYAASGGTQAALAVDLTIPGCPPAPARIVEGLRALVEVNAPPLARPPPPARRTPPR